MKIKGILSFTISMAILVFLLPPAVSAGDETILSIDSSFEKSSLLPHARTYVSGPEDIFDIQRFIPAGGKEIVVGSDTVTWYAAAIRVSPEQPDKQFILAVKGYLLHRYDLFLFREGQAFSLENAEKIHRIPPSKTLRNAILFPLSVKAGSKVTLVLRMQAFSDLIIPVVLFDSDTFNFHSKIENLIIGIVFGILLSMVLSNLIVYLSLHIKSYLVYVFYISCMVVYTIALNGRQVFLFNLDAVDSLIFLWVSLGLVTFSAVGFIKTFLSTRKMNGKIHHSLTIVQLAAVLLMAAGFLGFHNFARPLAVIAGIGVNVTGLAAGIVSLKNKYKPAQYFLVAWFILLMSALALAIRDVGIIPQTFPSELTMNMGASIEAILLSFALAYQLRVMRQEKEQLMHAKEKYRNKSRIDDLTGLYNAGYLKERVDADIDIALKSNQGLAMIMSDLDDFKVVNDTFGHLIGDQVLKRFGRICRSSARETDYACRYGGEEFVLVLPGAGIEKAMLVAERIRERFASRRFTSDDGRFFSGTVSIGVAELGIGESYDTLVAKADEAMYRAKHRGKNRVETSSV